MTYKALIALKAGNLNPTRRKNTLIFAPNILLGFCKLQMRGHQGLILIRARNDYNCLENSLSLTMEPEIELLKV